METTVNVCYTNGTIVNGLSWTVKDLYNVHIGEDFYTEFKTDDKKMLAFINEKHPKNISIDENIIIKLKIESVSHMLRENGNIETNVMLISPDNAIDIILKKLENGSGNIG